jgi:hypothetical protein
MELQFAGDIAVSPEQARRRANGFLSREVALFAEADTPVLMLGSHPVWRMNIHLILRGKGNMGQIGMLDVDAVTGEIFPLSEQQIREIQNHARTIVASSPQTTTPAS